MIKFKRLFKSFHYAWRGLMKIIREEQNIRVELLVAVIVILGAILIRFSRTDLAILLLVCLTVVLMEVINSAIELITDVLKPKLDNYVKEIKDIAAAAVMLASLTAVIIGLVLFSKYW